MDHKGIERLSLIGVPVDYVAREAMPHILLKLQSNKKSNQIVFLNLKLLLFARRNEEFWQTLNNAALILPVDKSLTNGLKFLHKIDTPRYLPYDFIITALTLFERSRSSVYLIGGNKKILKTADYNLRTSFPNLLFVGRHTGYFKKNDLQPIIEAVRKSSPSFIIASRGLKGGHRWLSRHSNHFNAGITLYNASFFDIIAGKKARPNSKVFEKGTNNWVKIFIQPWTIFSFLWYGILLLWYRFKKTT